VGAARYLSGLSAEQYFAEIRRAWNSIRVPGLLSGGEQQRVDTEQIKRALTSANPSLAAEDIAVECHNRYLAGVQICLGKDLRPVACQAVRDCTADDIRIPVLGQ
jgi:ribonuclease T2